MSTKEKYLHGYSQKEQKRLYEQARFLENIVYSEIDFSSITELLEVGGGVGAQTEILLRRFPSLRLTSIDYNADQIKQAKKFLASVAYAKGRYTINKMNAADMAFESATKFDGAFLCWILEHVPDPMRVLSEVRRVLKPRSQAVITEVLNATFFVEPYSPNVLKYWMRFNDLQYEMGGDPFVGAKLGNMLQSLGYTHIQTKVKTIHLDNRQPARRAEMIKYWTELMLSGAPKLVDAGYIDKKTVEKMKQEMHAVSINPSSVFFYSFIQAQAFTT
jgi:ubiquinone/menaquinone biosynthesis C-methylase UbiE